MHVAPRLAPAGESLRQIHSTQRELLESRARATQDQEGSRGTALERLYRGETDWNLEKVGADMRLS